MVKQSKTVISQPHFYKIHFTEFGQYSKCKNSSANVRHIKLTFLFEKKLSPETEEVNMFNLVPIL